MGSGDRRIGLDRFILFLIFSVAPPHFGRCRSIAPTNMPVRASAAASLPEGRINAADLIYSALLVPSSVLHGHSGCRHDLWRDCLICGAILIVLARQLIGAVRRSGAAHRLFAFSILYLFVLFAALLASHGKQRQQSMVIPFAVGALRLPPERTS